MNVSRFHRRPRLHARDVVAGFSDSDYTGGTPEIFFESTALHSAVIRPRKRLIGTADIDFILSAQSHFPLFSPISDDSHTSGDSPSAADILNRWRRLLCDQSIALA